MNSISNNHNAAEDLRTVLVVERALIFGRTISKSRNIEVKIAPHSKIDRNEQISYLQSDPLKIIFSAYFALLIEYAIR